MMNELKPCPFCWHYDELCVGKNSRGGVCVKCKYCGCEGPFGLKPEEAYILWNIRGGKDE